MSSKSPPRRHGRGDGIKQGYSSLEVKARVNGAWLEILGSLAPSLVQAIARLGKHVPCPVHGSRDGFRLYPNAPETGGGCCNTCGNFSDGFALLMWINDWPFPVALREVAKIIGLPTSEPLTPLPSRKPPKIAVSQHRAWARKNLERVWQQSMSADHPDAEPLRLYLANRGILLCHVPSDLRFHPSLHYLYSPQQGEPVDLGTFPAMLAVVRDAKGEPVTIHRTFLTPSGQKASIAFHGEELPAKKLMPATTQGATNGGAIRLRDAGPVLAVAEGIETALSVHLDSGLPVWATVSAGGMERLIIPSHVQEVLIAADNDASKAGYKAAITLAKRLQGDGRRVRIALPANPGQDWNDVLKAVDYGA